MKILKFNKQLIPYLLLGISLVGVFIFFIIPLFIIISECFTSGVNSKSFAGFSHFIDLFGNKAFQLAVKNTSLFYLITFPIMIIFPMLLALGVLKLNKKYSTIFSAILSLPLVIPLVSIMMILELFFTESGIINSLIAFLGAKSIDFYNSDAARGYLIFVFIFRYFGYNFLICLAGRMKIKNEIYEAAKLDGASASACFFKITCPLMLPTLFLSVMMTMLNSYKMFREAYMIGGNYPHESIYMIQHFINNNLKSLNYHRLAAASLMILSVTMVVILLLFFAQRKVDVEE